MFTTVGFCNTWFRGATTAMTGGGIGGKQPGGPPADGDLQTKPLGQVFPGPQNETCACSEPTFKAISAENHNAKPTILERNLNG
jgi:hypothetical protein